MERSDRHSERSKPSSRAMRAKNEPDLPRDEGLQANIPEGDVEGRSPSPSPGKLAFPKRPRACRRQALSRPRGFGGVIPRTGRRPVVAKKGPLGVWGRSPQWMCRGLGGEAPSYYSTPRASLRAQVWSNTGALAPIPLTESEALRGEAPYNIARSATGFRRKPRGLRG